VNRRGLLPLLCVGSGAVGGLVAARLHLAGAPVALLGRGAALEIIRRRGLDIIDLAPRRPGGGRASPGRIRHLRLPCFGRAAEAVEWLGPPAAVFFAVKTYDLAAAAAEVAAAVDTATTDGAVAARAQAARPSVVCLENGVGAEEIAAQYFPPAVIVAGAVTCSVERPEPGCLRVLTRGGMAFGPYQPDPGTQERGRTAATAAAATRASRWQPPPWVETLRAAGFEVRTYDRGDAVKWSKLLLNLWANASSAALGLPPQAVVRDRVAFHLDYRAFREALQVMMLAGIPTVDLPGYPVRLLARLGRLLPENLFRRIVGPHVSSGRGGKTPSLSLDLAAGRTRTEVGFLNGAVVAAGRRLGLATPANETLVAALNAKVRAAEQARRSNGVDKRRCPVDTEGWVT